MKVVHLGKFYPPASGGIETHTQTLARAQAALGADVRVVVVNHATPDGRDVTFDTFARTPDTTDADGPVRIYRAGKWGSLARFDLTPNQVRRDNYETLAARYGVTIEPPPPARYSIARQFTHTWPNRDSARADDYIAFRVEVPDSYEVVGAGMAWERWAWEDEEWHFQIFPRLEAWLGRWGTLELACGTRWVSAFAVMS